jgi:hypothetical protein
MCVETGDGGGALCVCRGIYTLHLVCVCVFVCVCVDAKLTRFLCQAPCVFQTSRLEGEVTKEAYLQVANTNHTPIYTLI